VELVPGEGSQPMGGGGARAEGRRGAERGSRPAPEERDARALPSHEPSPVWSRLLCPQELVPPLRGCEGVRVGVANARITLSAHLCMGAGSVPVDR
jgi:hypothetical protein